MGKRKGGSQMKGPRDPQMNHFRGTITVGGDASTLVYADQGTGLEGVTATLGDTKVRIFDCVLFPEDDGEIGAGTAGDNPRVLFQLVEGKQTTPALIAWPNARILGQLAWTAYTVGANGGGYAAPLLWRLNIPYPIDTYSNYIELMVKSAADNVMFSDMVLAYDISYMYWPGQSNEMMQYIQARGAIVS